MEKAKRKIMISWHAEDESIVLFLVLYYTITKPSLHSPGGYCQLFKINKLGDIISERQESSIVIHFGQLIAIDKEIFL